MREVKTSWLQTQKDEIRALKGDLRKILKWLDHSEVQEKKVRDLKGKIRSMHYEQEQKWREPAVRRNSGSSDGGFRQASK